MSSLLQDLDNVLEKVKSAKDCAAKRDCQSHNAQRDNDDFDNDNATLLSLVGLLPSLYNERLERR